MSAKAYDVLVIGGGLAGTAAAYRLSQRGARVLLLEAKSLSSGTTGACAGRAQIIEGDTDGYLSLVVEGFSLLEGLGEELDMDLEWELPGHLTLLRSDEQRKAYARHVRHMNRMGLPAEMMGKEALSEAEPALRADGFIGAAYSHEGHLNPFKLCMGFARAASRNGAVICAHTPVTGFEIRSGRVEAVLTPKGKFTAGTVLFATGAWSGAMITLAGSSLPMNFTHAEAIISEPLPRVLNHHIGMTGFYEAVHGQARTVTLGVGQHQNGTLLVSNAIQQAQVIDQGSTYWGMPALARALGNTFPCLSSMRFMRTWAAPSPFLPDYHPAIGWLPDFENAYVAAGFHLAIPTIPLLSSKIAEEVLDGERVPLLEPFTPARFPVTNSAELDS